MNILNHKQQQTQQANNQGLLQQIQEIKKLVGARNPKEVFYEMCKQRGIDPNEIIKLLK